MTIDEMIAVLQAAKAGKSIQCRCKAEGDNDWDCGSNRESGWLDFQHYDYRVKPEPREWRVSVNEAGDITSGVPGEDVNPGLFSDRYFNVLVREVLG